MYTNGTTHIDMHEFTFISQLRHSKLFILPVYFWLSSKGKKVYSPFTLKKITSQKGWEKRTDGFTFKTNVRNANYLLMMVADVIKLSQNNKPGLF